MRLLTIIALCGASIACGPSPRWTYLGNRYFEYCHRADLERSASDAELAQCWDAWLKSYAVGQSRERLQHAKERRMLLRGGEALRMSMPSIDAQDVQVRDHPTDEPHQDCATLCDTQHQRCLEVCAERVDDAERDDKDTAAVDDAEVKREPAARGSEPVTGSSPTRTGNNCLPACDQEQRVCRQGCL